MLHEKVEVKWDELQCIIDDFQTLENLRNFLVVGGSTLFIGLRPRTREVLQTKMYMNEINEWISEANLEEKCISNITHNIEDGHSESTLDTDHLVMIDNLGQ